MLSPRGSSATAAVAILLGVAAIGEIRAQGNGSQPTTPAEMAKAIARTIDANTMKMATGPTSFVSATAHDNIVEILYATRDAKFFAENKANAESTRLTFAHFYCDASRKSYLNSGVVIHQTLTSPDNSDRVEFTADRATCASLSAAPSIADAQTLAKTAQTVAQTENTTNKSLKPNVNTPFRIEDATSHDGIVEIRSSVVDASIEEKIKANPRPMIGILQGYYCDKYGDYIRSGLSLHAIILLANGTPVVDFTIDKSSCG